MTLATTKRALSLLLSKAKSMAHPNITLINALREAAQKLRNGSHYAWGHHGSCNCGHVLQVVTQLSKEEIVRHAQTVAGEWTEIAEEYCGVTNAPAYLLVSKLERVGLTPTDIHNLEYLEDRKVLDNLPGGFRWLKRNVRENVIVYFESFAAMLEEQLLNSIALPKVEEWQMVAV
ncbi:MAG: hypothetical protein EOO53_21420 [Gammaproteobacteria bacterium]|nr:MAG: hypothetical protein EOO53_21420 [Gammaproteobacteria bacterium]